jgi:molybdenum cofactor cytidylyltransferase
MPTDRDGRVAGVVLAAGTSTRMGRNKLFFEIEGKPLLHRTVRAALDGGLDPVIVVVGHEAPRAVESIADLYCQPVLNPNYAQGINSSVRVGIASVPEEADAAVVMLADMPFVSAGMIAALVMRYREAGVPLVVSSYGEVTAPPTLYDRALFAEFRLEPARLPDVPPGVGSPPGGREGVGTPDPPGDSRPRGAGGCGKHIVNRHRHEATFIAWPLELLTDVDVPADYERVKTLIEEGSHQHAR